MPAQVYYPTSPSSLDIIAKSMEYFNAKNDAIIEQLLKANPTIRNSHDIQPPQTPFILPDDSNIFVDAPACSNREHQLLAGFSGYAGGATTMALAELVDELKLHQYTGDANTFGTGGVGQYVKSAGGILEKVENYDRAIKEFESYKHHRAANNTLHLKEQEAKRAFMEMNEAFNRKGQTILHKHKGRMRKAFNLRGKEVFESIPVGSNADIQNLTRFAKYGRVAGPGFIAIDGGLRAKKVLDMKNSDDSRWKREAVVQAGAFAAALGAGVAIAFFIAPVGVGFIVGAVVAGTAAVVLDKIAQDLIGRGYDKWIN